MLQVGDLQIDIENRKLWRQGQFVKLTKTDWQLLEKLLENANHVVTRDALGLELWNSDDVRDLLDQTISRLRKKIEDNNRKPQYLVTVAGIGYRFNIPQRLKATTNPYYLPFPVSLIGRDQVVAQIGAFLQHQTTRLVTLTGPGGIGKTQLALEVAQRALAHFSDGICFVDLAPINDPALLPNQLVNALGMQQPTDRLIDKQKPADRPIDKVADYLRTKNQFLLVLDNFEHVMAASADLAELLRRVPALKVLVTSREGLNLLGEQHFQVFPLPVPDAGELADHDALRKNASVALFLQCLRQHMPGFTEEQHLPAIGVICTRLEGWPLALELAAPHVKHLGVQGVLDDLEERFTLLESEARDRPLRQQTMWNAIDWSYTLLAPEEQAFFIRLAVFVGGLTRDAAKAVCFSTTGVSTGEVGRRLRALIDKSLLQLHDEPEASARYTLLETIREYALRRLETDGEAQATHERHATYYLALAEESAPKLKGEQQQISMRRLEREHNNIRAALQYWLDHDQGEQAARLSAALVHFWFLHDDFAEGLRWLEKALEYSDDLPAGLQAQLYFGLGWLADSRGELERALAAYDRCLTIRTGHDDRRGIALAHFGQGRVLRSKGEYREATEALGKSLALAVAEGDHWLIAAVRNVWGWVLLRQGDRDGARQQLEDSLVLAQVVGDTERLAWAVFNLGNFWAGQNDFERAKDYFARSRDLFGRLGNKGGQAMSLTSLGVAYVDLEVYDQAELCLTEGKALSEKIGDQQGIAVSLVNLGDLARGRDDWARAGELYEAGLKIAAAIEQKDLIGYCLIGYASTVAKIGSVGEAAELVGMATRYYEEIDVEPFGAAAEMIARTMVIVQGVLGEQGAAAAMEQGRSLGLEQMLRRIDMR